jgi:hypothetical protein
VEQQRAAGGAERQVAKLVEDDEIGVDKPPSELPRLSLELFLFEGVDEFDRGEEPDALAMMLDGLAAERLHGDDTTVPILAKGKTDTGRIWVYVRDDRPFGGHGPPAALFYASRDRTAENPERHLAGWSGLLQADAYSGYNGLYQPERKPGRIVAALCWSHAGRKFFELADIAANARLGKTAPPILPIALEAVKRIDAIFASNATSTGSPPTSGCACGEKPPLHSSLRWRRGCAPSEPNSHVTPPSPKGNYPPPLPRAAISESM